MGGNLTENDLMRILRQPSEREKKAQRLGKIIEEVLLSLPEDSQIVELVYSPESISGRKASKPKGYRIDLKQDIIPMTRVAERIASKCGVCFREGYSETFTGGVRGVIGMSCSEAPSFYKVLVDESTEVKGLKQRAKKAIKELLDAHHKLNKATDKLVDYLTED